MVPVRTPPATLAQREDVRKRQLFSVMLLVIMVSTITIGGVLALMIRSANQQAPICLLIVVIVLVAMWLNRVGYLKSACTLFYLCMGITIFMSPLIRGSDDPLFLLWCSFVLTNFIISLAFFVPAWIVFAGAVVENFLYFICLYYLNINRILPILTKLEFEHAFFFLCLLIYGSALLGMLYAITTRRAVIKADRAAELEQAHRTISDAYARLEEAHATIQMQALTDGLTGLPNHGAIVTKIEAELQRCRTSRRNCAIIFVDIDHFKSINDTWGHAAGDAALCEVGHRLHLGIRACDSVGRYGGEEFVILLSDIELLDALELTKHLCRSIAETPCLWTRQESQQVVSIPLTASFGLAMYPLNGLAAGELLDTADSAMYIAKRTGRNRVCLPDDTALSWLKEEKKGGSAAPA